MTSFAMITQSGLGFMTLGEPNGPQAAKCLETIALFVVPFSYSYVFAATQGIVSAFDDSYGHRFWVGCPSAGTFLTNPVQVFVNACFLLPGLPCALLQSKFDFDIDVKYGSALTFQVCPPHAVHDGRCTERCRRFGCCSALFV